MSGLSRVPPLVRLYSKIFVYLPAASLWLIKTRVCMDLRPVGLPKKNKKATDVCKMPMQVSGAEETAHTEVPALGTRLFYKIHRCTAKIFMKVPQKYCATK